MMPRLLLLFLFLAGSAIAQDAAVTGGGDAAYFCFERTLKEHPEMKKEAAAKACGMTVTKELRKLWKAEEKHAKGKR